jgi:hypothetical protein
MIVELEKQTIKVTKQGEVREVKTSRLEEYLNSGWQQSSSIVGEEVIRLKPPAKKSKAAEPIAEEANDNIQGD